jgi:predicted NAD/FAD-dependent oxidoreductase
MQRAFAARLARPLAQKNCVAIHWHAAAPAEPLAQPYLWDPDRAVGLAGDWCGGARIESAFLSGTALARAIAA